MADLVYIATGLRGSLYNTTEFCRRLSNSGHEVTVLAFRDVRAEVEAVGADFVMLSAGPIAHERLAAEVNRVGKIRSLPLARRLRKSLVSSTQVVDIVQGIGPDLLLIDGEMHAAIISTRKLHIPTLAVLPFFSVYREPGVPPLNSTLPPGDGLAARARCNRAWASLWITRLLLRTVGRFTPRSLRLGMLPFHLNSPALVNIRAVARFCRFDLRAGTTWRPWLHPHMYCDLPVLSYTTAELDFARHAPDNFHYVGPMINDQRVEPLVSADEFDRWTEFRDRTALAGVPLIYCSMGSLQPASAEYYRPILDACTRRPDWAFVFGLGDRGDPTTLGPIPDNALLLSYAPQLEVLKHASAAIHSGGIGTLHECVHQLVPSVVCSTMLVDQPGVVARVNHFGLGLSISLEQLSSERVEAAVADVLARPRTEALAAQKQAIDRYTTDEVGLKLVASYLRQTECA